MGAKSQSLNSVVGVTVHRTARTSAAEFQAKAM